MAGRTLKTPYSSYLPYTHANITNSAACTICPITRNNRTKLELNWIRTELENDLSDHT